MSFLKKLFGGGDAAADGPKPRKSIEYKGYTIKATPYVESGQYQTCGVISKDADGEKKEHRFIRADRFADEDSAADHAILKGQQMVDQMGEAIFR